MVRAPGAAPACHAGQYQMLVLCCRPSGCGGAVHAAFRQRWRLGARVINKPFQYQTRARAVGRGHRAKLLAAALLQTAVLCNWHSIANPWPETMRNTDVVLQAEVAGGRRVKLLAAALFQTAVLGNWLRSTKMPLLRRVLSWPRGLLSRAAWPHSFYNVIADLHMDIDETRYQDSIGQPKGHCNMQPPTNCLVQPQLADF